MDSKERVIKIIMELTGAKKDTVKLESTLIDDLAWDELDLVEVTMALEEEFETEIPDTVADNFKTVQNIVDYIDGTR
jgi:acyl carrier protein